MQPGKPVLRGWFSFSGRRNRKSYFLCSILQLAIAVILIFVMLVVVAAFSLGEAILFFLFAIAALAAIFFSSYIIAAQRFRDIGCSGWTSLIFVFLFAMSLLNAFASMGERYVFGIAAAPILNYWDLASLIIWLALILIPGNRGENQYGPDPLEPQRQDSETLTPS